MRESRPPKSILGLLLFSIIVTSCVLFDGRSAERPDFSPIPTPSDQLQTQAPIEPATESLPTAAPPTPQRDTGWNPLHPGMERRTLRLFSDDGAQYDSIYMIRVDPAQHRFTIGYRPGSPQSLKDWQRETGALLLVNGGFFTPEFEATALMVIDGQATGRSYRRAAGMLAITEQGPELRVMPRIPYDPDESLRYALQSFPVLVQPGGLAGYRGGDPQRARRTVIALDVQGRVVFLASHWGSFTLGGLGAFLIESDLDIDVALNLDGGASTGILLADPDEGIPAFSLLPIVIAVYPN